MVVVRVARPQGERDEREQQEATQTRWAQHGMSNSTWQGTCPTTIRSTIHGTIILITIHKCLHSSSQMHVSLYEGSNRKRGLLARACGAAFCRGVPSLTGVVPATHGRWAGEGEEAGGGGHLQRGAGIETLNRRRPSGANIQHQKPITISEWI